MHIRFLTPTLVVLGVAGGCSDSSEEATTDAGANTRVDSSGVDQSTVGSSSSPTQGAESENETATGVSTVSGTSESSPADTSTGEPGDGEASSSGGSEPDPRQVILETYAPQVWFTSQELYWPSSVEWAFTELERVVGDEARYQVQTIEPLESPSDTLPFFAGDLSQAPIYGYWADKGEGIVDLVYFVYFPYNRGKSVIDTIWGNHVGDWEHITVRLLVDADDGRWSPSQVYLSAHNFGGAYDWGSGDVELFDGTHPVVYTATGSHGFWAEPGDHVYMSIGQTDPLFGVCLTVVCVDLVDKTAPGVAWNTWDVVYGMDFFAQQGLAGLDWPVWMSEAFSEPGAGDPSIPGEGAIYRWGNAKDCSILGLPFDITDIIGVCRLEHGPTGPVSKSTWGAELR